MGRRFLVNALLTLGALLCLGHIVVQCLGMSRSLTPGSKLGFLETRIASTEEEFMRRSYKLRANFQQFTVCMNTDGCSPEPILKERDALIVRLWPGLFERLSITDDWGEGAYSKEYHLKFQQDVRAAGGTKKARQCLPKIQYYLLRDGNTIYTYDGLRCP